MVHLDADGSSEPRPTRQTYMLAGAVLLMGLAVRIALLVALGPVELVFDGHTYVDLATRLLMTGTYEGDWPPGYTAIVAAFLQRWGVDGLALLRATQIGVSLPMGALVMRLAYRIFQCRGMLVAGLAWAVYLPVAAFSHLVWPETLFLVPFVAALDLIHVACRGRLPGARAELLLTLAGLLWGASLLVKEVAVHLTPLLALWILWHARGRLGRSALFCLAAGVVVFPWTLRNYERYERFSLIGHSLNRNILSGLNAGYVNHDYNYDAEVSTRAHLDAQGNVDFVGRVLMNYGPGWTPSELPNIVDQQRENASLALTYAAGHPLEFAATRIKKFADFVTPFSSLVCDLCGGVYRGANASPATRHFVTLFTVTQVLLLLPFGWLGLVRTWSINRNAAVFLGMILVYFAATSLLVATSRFRIPIEPLLCVLLGSYTVKCPPRVRLWLHRLVGVLGVLCLFGLWAINLSEVHDIIRRTW